MNFYSFGGCISVGYLMAYEFSLENLEMLIGEIRKIVEDNSILKFYIYAKLQKLVQVPLNR